MAENNTGLIVGAVLLGTLVVGGGVAFVVHQNGVREEAAARQAEQQHQQFELERARLQADLAAAQRQQASASAPPQTLTTQQVGVGQSIGGFVDGAIGLLGKLFP